MDHLLVDGKRLIELSEAGELNAMIELVVLWRKVAFAATPPSHRSSPIIRQDRGWGGVLAARRG